MSTHDDSEDPRPLPLTSAASERTWEGVERDGVERFKRQALSAATGGSQLGCSLYEVPAGTRAWPHHLHFGNEEALYVLEGSGTLRLGTGASERRTPLEPGTWAVFPVGEAGAHSLVASEAGPLKFLCMSTMRTPDITGYPDSDKFGLFAGSAPGGAPEERTLTAFLPNRPEDYWEREP